VTRRKICVVTGTRAEYGLLRWTMKEIQQDPELELQIIATCAHLSPEFGLTYRNIEEDGFKISSRVEMLLSSDTPVGVTKSMGLGMIGFADAFNELRPDIIVVLGDRFEILAAASAAIVARIPLAHVSGGEVTRGAIDDSIRHAITKMATYHFPGAEAYRERIIRMGEQPANVKNFGDPGLDNLHRLPLLSRDALEKELNFPLGHPTFLVTYHPATLGSLKPNLALTQLFKALDRFPKARVIFTKPNADAGGRQLAKMIDEFGTARPERVLVVTSLGQARYLSAMKHCDLVIGNSSSGIVEAPALGKATVNIGERQDGRLKASSVIDCPEESSAIVSAIEKALSPEFQALVKNTESLYGDSDTSRRIVAFLKQANLTAPKQFYDPSNGAAPAAITRIGGEFEIAPSTLQSNVFATSPRLPLPHTISLDTGRSGIFVALQDILRRGGRKVAYLPAYCCESVLFPFQQLGFEMKFYSAGKDLVSPAGLPTDFEDATFLYIHYFGLRNEQVTRWIDQMRPNSRFFVIEDCVQAGLTRNVGNNGDYAVKSFRKIASQPDGAVLGSRTPLLDIALQDSDETFVSQKLVGKILRYQDAPDELYLDLFENSESRLSSHSSPRRASWASSYLMERTDFSQLAVTRRNNWAYLHHQLQQDDSELIDPLFKDIKDDEVPLGYPVIVAQGLRDLLRMFLKERRVFCPVHWPLGAEQQRSGWTEDLWLSRNMLTIPIDQRMDASSLDYVASCIRQFSPQR
jgi:UDP-hydrolysing UDP-N-acetyl-D-glucosamine 2-epimerase